MLMQQFCEIDSQNFSLFILSSFKFIFENIFHNILIIDFILIRKIVY